MLAPGPSCRWLTLTLASPRSTPHRQAPARSCPCSSLPSQPTLPAPPPAHLIFLYSAPFTPPRQARWRSCRCSSPRPTPCGTRAAASSRLPAPRRPSALCATWVRAQGRAGRLACGPGGFLPAGQRWRPPPCCRRLAAARCASVADCRTRRPLPRLPADEAYTWPGMKEPMVAKFNESDANKRRWAGAARRAGARPRLAGRMAGWLPGRPGRLAARQSPARRAAAAAAASRVLPARGCAAHPVDFSPATPHPHLHPPTAQARGRHAVWAAVRQPGAAAARLRRRCVGRAPVLFGCVCTFLLRCGWRGGQARGAACRELWRLHAECAPPSLPQPASRYLVSGRRAQAVRGQHPHRRHRGGDPRRAQGLRPGAAALACWLVLLACMLAGLWWGWSSRRAQGYGRARRACWPGVPSCYAGLCWGWSSRRAQGLRPGAGPPGGSRSIRRSRAAGPGGRGARRGWGCEARGALRAGRRPALSPPPRLQKRLPAKQIIQIHVQRDKDTGAPRGAAYIWFARRRDADFASARGRGPWPGACGACLGALGGRRAALRPVCGCRRPLSLAGRSPPLCQRAPRPLLPPPPPPVPRPPALRSQAPERVHRRLPGGLGPPAGAAGGAGGRVRRRRRPRRGPRRCRRARGRGRRGGRARRRGRRGPARGGGRGAGQAR